jgi:Beta-lactamase superfamily domain
MNAGFSIPNKSKNTLSDFVGSFLGEVKNDDEFKGMYADAQEKQILLEKFIAPSKSRKPAAPQLVILRKWNSYTPLLPPSHEEFLNKGGGYFLSVGDIGVVIDPGFNFIENFLKAGFRIDDIDHIVVSHAHNDHTVELEGLFSLLFKRNKRAAESKKKAKRVRLYLNLGAFKKFSAYFDLSNPPKESYVDEIILLNRRQHYHIDNGIDLFTTQAKHHEMITEEYALGFIISVACPNGKTCRIRFTCDSGWDTKMEEKNRSAAEDHQMDQIHILVAHIGSLKSSELKYLPKYTLESPENEGAVYRYHLGLIGTVAAINFWKPELALLSEFGEEMSNVRVPLAERLADRLQTPVFPTDLNFRIELQSRKIWCFNSRRFCKPTDVEVFSHDTQLYPISNAPSAKNERNDLHDALGREITVFRAVATKKKYAAKKSIKKAPAKKAVKKSPAKKKPATKKVGRKTPVKKAAKGKKKS